MSRADKHKVMKFPGKDPPQTAAQRQAKCRAVKRGEWYTVPATPVPPPPAPALGQPTAPAPAPALGQPPALGQTAGRSIAALPPSQNTPPPAAPAPAPAPPALPAPPATAIQRSLPADAIPLALSGGEDRGGDASRVCLPPAVAARLRSLLDKHQAGKHPLTAAERAEAEGLLDIAEYFVVQRMRRQLAA